MNIEQLQQAYQRRDWTLVRLGIEADVNPCTVGAVLRGDSVTVRSMEAVADALGFRLILVPKSEVEP